MSRSHERLLSGRSGSRGPRSGPSPPFGLEDQERRRGWAEPSPFDDADPREGARPSCRLSACRRLGGPVTNRRAPQAGSTLRHGSFSSDDRHELRSKNFTGALGILALQVAARARDGGAPMPDPLASRGPGEVRRPGGRQGRCARPSGGRCRRRAGSAIPRNGIDLREILGGKTRMRRRRLGNDTDAPLLEGTTATR